jgi:hypothetical protein
MAGASKENKTKEKPPVAKEESLRRKVNIAEKNQVRAFDEASQWSIRSSDYGDKQHLFNPNAPGPTGPCHKIFSKASKKIKHTTKTKMLKVDEFTAIEKPKKVSVQFGFLNEIENQMKEELDKIE